MRHLERKDGFTLVELVVGIACAAMVMAAAAALLLMGARIQRTLRDEAKEQQTVRIVLTMLEDLVTEGKIEEIKTATTSEDGFDGWVLCGESDPLLSYDSAAGALKNGDNTLLDGLVMATAGIEGNLLNFAFATENGAYDISTYCRTLTVGGDSQATISESVIDLAVSQAGANIGNAETNARYAFLQTLCAEYGSTGAIQNGDNAGTYYSEWYIGDYESNPGWNSSTPWCACFLSWAAQNISNAPRFANVDTGIAWFQTNNKFLSKGSTPIPGDYIFFDWEQDTDPDHVGVVLYVHDNMIYTIEGNSGSRVAIRSYLSTDKRIMGYGVLPWQST